MPNRVEYQRAKATSNYRQFKLLCTAEVGGRISYSIWVKPLAAEWSQKQCVVRDSIGNTPMPESLDDVYRILLQVLGGEVLPSPD